MIIFRNTRDTLFTAGRRKAWYLVSVLLMAPCPVAGLMASLFCYNIEVDFLKYLALTGFFGLLVLAIFAVFLAIAKSISITELLLYWFSLLVIAGAAVYFVLLKLQNTALHHPHY